MSENIKEKALDIISEQLEVDREKITAGSHFQSDLGADSLDLTEMIMAFEEEFGIDIPDEEAQQLPTVEDVIKKLEELTTA
jgi:acyl carrier protein